MEDMSPSEIVEHAYDFLHPPPPMTEADRQLLKEAVANVIGKIKEHAIPYFERAAQGDVGSGENPAPNCCQQSQHSL